MCIYAHPSWWRFEYDTYISCLFNTSSYFSLIDIHPPLGDDASSTINTWVSSKTCKGSSRAKAHGDSSMWLDMFWHFYLLLAPTLRVNICHVICQIWHFSFLPSSLFSQGSQSLWHSLGSSNRSFTPHFLKHFIMSRT